MQTKKNLPTYICDAVARRIPDEIRCGFAIAGNFAGDQVTCARQQRGNASIVTGRLGTVRTLFSLLIRAVKIATGACQNKTGAAIKKSFDSGK
ncbi:MAG TPA: hypothetical protein VFL07_01150 [Rudaea sp.]|nr:hypothetical protein [Rudaea sp.]